MSEPALEKPDNCSSSKLKSGLRSVEWIRAAPRARGIACTEATLHMPTRLEHQPDAQRTLVESRVRETSRLSPRERVVEIGAGGSFLAMALALWLLEGTGNR